MSKICICLIGQMRTYDHINISNSYKKYLSSYEIIDLNIFTWKNRGFSHSHGLYDTNDHQYDIINQDDLIRYYSQFPFFNVKKIVIDDFDLFYESLDSEKNNIFNKPFRGHSNITTSIPIEYKYQQAGLYLSSIDYSIYSNILIIRPDMIIVDDLPIIKPEENTIYFKHICHLCMDISWLGKPSTIIKQLSDIYDNYISNTNNIPPFHCDNTDNNLLLHYQCKVKNINVKNIDGHFVRLQRWDNKVI